VLALVVFDPAPLVEAIGPTIGLTLFIRICLFFKKLKAD
jgi:hypothetical protein